MQGLVPGECPWMTPTETRYRMGPMVVAGANPMEVTRSQGQRFPIPRTETFWGGFVDVDFAEWGNPLDKPATGPRCSTPRRRCTGMPDAHRP